MLLRPLRQRSLRRAVERPSRARQLTAPGKFLEGWRRQASEREPAPGIGELLGDRGTAGRPGPPASAASTVRKATISCICPAWLESSSAIDDLSSALPALTRSPALFTWRTTPFRVPTIVPISSKPPSSDPPATARSRKAPTGRKPGGQPGHSIHERTFLELDRSVPGRATTFQPVCDLPLKPRGVPARIWSGPGRQGAAGDREQLGSSHRELGALTAVGRSSTQPARSS